MPNVIVQPFGPSGVANLDGSPRTIQSVVVGGYLYRHVLENRDNPPEGISAGDLLWFCTVDSVGYLCTGYPNPLSWNSIGAEMDDAEITCHVVDAASSSGDPCPTLRAWSEALATSLQEG
jgi:hypothetical protein